MRLSSCLLIVLAVVLASCSLPVKNWDEAWAEGKADQRFAGYWKKIIPRVGVDYSTIYRVNNMGGQLEYAEIDVLSGDVKENSKVLFKTYEYEGVIYALCQKDANGKTVRTLGKLMTAGEGRSATIFELEMKQFMHSVIEQGTINSTERKLALTGEVVELNQSMFKTLKRHDEKSYKGVASFQEIDDFQTTIENFRKILISRDKALRERNLPASQPRGMSLQARSIDVPAVALVQPKPVEELLGNREVEKKEPQKDEVVVPEFRQFVADTPQHTITIYNLGAEEVNHYLKHYDYSAANWHRGAMTPETGKRLFRVLDTLEQEDRPTWKQLRTLVRLDQLFSAEKEQVAWRMVVSEASQEEGAPENFILWVIDRTSGRLVIVQEFIQKPELPGSKKRK